MRLELFVYEQEIKPPTRAMKIVRVHDQHRVNRYATIMLGSYVSADRFWKMIGK